MNEQEANKIPDGPRWLWDWKWWATILMIGGIWFALRWLNGTL